MSTLADSNVWLALILTGHDFHRVVSNWFAGVTQPREVLLCRSTQQSLLRLLTSPAVLGAFGNPALTNEEAWKVYDGVMADRRIAFASEPPDVERTWQALARRDSASPKLWMDAYLAAFAIAGRYRLVTTDTGFRQFPKLDLLLL